MTRDVTRALPEWCRAVWSDEGRGIALSAVMVLSMVALAFAGGAAGADGVESDITTDEVAEIDDALLDEAAEEPVTAVVRLGAADRSTLAGTTVVDQLQQHAEETQQPLLEHARDDEGVEVLNRFWLANAVLVETDRAGLQALAEVPGVDRIHENFELTTTDGADADTAPAGDDISADEEYTYGLEMINAPDVWDDFGTQGEGVGVAVLDTGVDDSHPDLPTLSDEQWGHWDDSGAPIDSEPNDGNDHGTHVSGTVVGSDDPDGDVPGFGVAPGATLYHGKVLADNGGGTFAQIIAGMEWVVDDIDVEIASMSLGADGQSEEMVEPSENMREAGIVLVASAGNSGAGASGSPGNVFPNVASGAVNEDEDVAGFSSGEVIDTGSDWGSAAPEYWPDEYVVPNAAAPGVDVLSAVPGGSYDGTFSGTSMSAPHKAGTFALMLSFAPEADRAELVDAVETTARKPDDWDEPDDEPDIRYGYGIIDAYEAVLEVNPLSADSVLGDVTETGEVTLTDALLVQEEVADVRDPDTPFFEFAGDLNRDGEVTGADATLAQERVAGTIDESEIAVDDIDAPRDVEGGATVDVSAELENLGEIGALEDIEWRIAPEGEGLDEGTTVRTQFVDMAVSGVDDPVSLPAETTLEFEEIATGALPGGEYEHGVFSGADNATETITINAPFFEVTDLDAPATVPVGETFDVSATITNTGNDQDDQTVTYEFPEAGVTETVELDLSAGESDTVVFEDIDHDVLPDTYTHGVATADDEAVATIDVVEPFFEVRDLEAPEAVNVGDEITVDAVVENVGGLADEQEITYDLSEDALLTVAVVDSDLETDERAARLAERTDLSPEERVQRAAEIQAATDLSEFLAEELDDDVFDVVDVNSADLMENTGHDVYVINQFTEAVDAGEFRDELGEDQATIHLDQFGGEIDDTTDGVVRLVLDEGDPFAVEGTFGQGSGANLHIGSTVHPLLDGVGDPGDIVQLHEAQDRDRVWHTDYSGTDLAQVAGSGTPDGPAVAVNDEKDQILLTSQGRDTLTPQESYTDAENTLMLNAVEYAAFEQARGGLQAATSETLQLDPGEEAPVSFEYTVQEDDAGAVTHRVSSDDDFATAPVEIAADEQVNVVDLDLPDSVDQGVNVTATATLEHVGTEATTQTAEYIFDGAVEDTAEFSLEPGETTEVTLEYEVPVDLTSGVYSHGVALPFDEVSTVVEVVEAGAAFFDVTDFTAPDEADPGEEIPVSATVTNTGDLAGTQIVDYQFDVETPELTPLDVAVVDLGGDDGDNGGFLVDMLEERLDEDDSVTGYFEGDIADWEDAVTEDEHDVHLIHSVDTETELMEHFLEERGPDTTGVLLDNRGTGSAFEADAVFELQSATADPAFVIDSVSGSDDATMTIEQDHPIFDGVGEVGDTVQILAQTEDGGIIAWMEEFSAEEIAAGSLGDEGGTTAAIDHERGLVLQSQLGAGVYDYDGGFDDESPFFNETFDIIHNSVEFAGSGDLSPQTDATASDAVEADDELQVAVVELAHTGGGSHGEIIGGILEDRLDNANIDLFFQDAIDGGEDAAAWESQLNDYDVQVVQAWGTHHSDHGTEHLEHFVETVDASTAAVLLDQRGDSSTLHADAVEQYGLETGDPGLGGTAFSADVGAYVHAEQDHPIFEGVIDEGESTLVVNTDDDSGWLRTFGDTDAEIIGTGQFGESGSTEGPTVGVDEERQLVFQSMLGGDISDPDEKTENAQEILANSVRFADDELLAEGEQPVTLEPGESETVAFNVTVPEVEAGEYGHGIFSANDSDTAPVTVQQLDEYELSNLDPEDAEVVVGEDGAIDVTVDVDNVGAQPGGQPVVLNVTEDDTGELVYTETVENVTIEPGEGQTVTFADVPANALDRGDYTHTVSSDDDAVAGSLSVFEEVFFEVSDLDAPAEVFGGETFDVSATVTNTVEEIPVAVVESDGFDSAPLVDELDERTGDRFAYETVDSEAFLESPDSFVGQYESVFIADLFDDGELPSDEDVEALVDAAEEAGTGLVFAEQYSTVPITALSSALDDPESASDAFDQGEPLIQIDAPDHPLFAGIEGEEFVAHDGSSDDYHSFEGYSGEVLADVAPGGDVDDSAIGIDDEAGHVLLGTVTADETFVDWSDLTEESWTVLANSVEYLAGDADADVSPAFTDTQTIEYVLDGNVEDSEELTLDAGESDTVTFDDIPAELAPGTYEHGVESADDAETATIDIVAGAEYELSNLDPAEAEVGEDDDFIDVSVDIENVGDTTQPLDVDLDVIADAGDGELAFEDTVAGVEVDPGVTETVTFEDVPVGALDGGEYEHTVSTVGDSISGSLTVLEPVFFDVSELDGPDSVESGGAVTVSANVTNSLPPEPDEAVVSVVDSTFAASEAGALADHLESTLGEGYVVEELAPDELLSNTDSEVYVLQEFGEVDAGEFLGLLGDDQAVVALDQDGDDADAVTSLANDTGEPDAVETDAIGGPHANLELTAGHPIFDGVGDVGETITYHEGFDADRGWFEGYAGDALAEIQAPADEIDTGGPAVGVDDDTNQVLLPSSARTTFVTHEEFTDAEHTLVTNAVAYAATEQAGVEPGASDGDVGADETATQVVEYRVDGETLDDESVTLDAGESQTVTFDDVTIEFEPGEYEHGVFSIDDEATATLTITDNGGDDAEVAVVNPEQDDSVSTLMDELESDTNAATAFVESDTLVDDPESVMADHDAVVFLHYGFFPLQGDVEPIRNAARDTDTGLVHLDPASEKYGDFFGNTIWALPESFEVEPAPNSITATGVDAEQSVEVAVDDEDSPLFDGIEADQFAIRSDDVTDHETTVFDFPDDADVERVGFGVDPEDGTQTDPVAVEDPNNPELYLSVGANGAEQSFADHTDDALQLIANGVASVSDAVTADSSESTRTAAVAVP